MIRGTGAMMPMRRPRGLGVRAAALPFLLACIFATAGFARAETDSDAAATESVAPAAKSAASEDDSTVFRRSAAEFRVKVQPRQVRPGETVTLSVTVKLDSPYHIYAVDQPWSPSEGATLPTAIELKETGQLEPVGAGFEGPQPIEKTVAGTLLRYHEGEFAWTRQLRVSENASHGEQQIAGAVGYMICTDKTCDFPAGFELRGSVEVADTAVEEPTHFELTPLANPGQVIRLVERVVAARNGADQTGETGARGAGGSFDGQKGGSTPEAMNLGLEGSSKDKNLILFILAALGAGFASLLTPCVFPLVPITVSFFTKQAEKEHHRPVTMALVYCLGIVATFTLLGLFVSLIFGATFLNKFASNGFLNLFIALLLVFFALNLFGMYEIRVPAALTRYTSGKQGRGGYAGVLFMAVTFTITSFTCTLPIVGLVLVGAAAGDIIWPTVGLIAFSLAFCLPFFFLALFPSLLASMPKSGGWMNGVKVVMGFLELGAAFKFFSNSDLVWSGTPVLFSYEFVLVAWIITSALAGLYLLNLFRLPHDVPVERIGVVRMLISMGFLFLAAHMAVGLFGKNEPEDQLWKKIKAFAPPKMEMPAAEIQVAAQPAGATDDSPVKFEHGLSYYLDYAQAADEARTTNSLLFIDFTGLVCVNCREMEQQVFPKPEVASQLRKYVRARLYTDSIPHVPSDVADKLLEQNRQLQTDWFGDVTLPSYAIATPAGKLVGKLTGQQSVETFRRFLQSGLEQWETRQAAGRAPSGVARARLPAGP